jgi:hypothetical protein
MLESAAFAGQAAARIPVPEIDWVVLGLLAASLLLAALYALAASGHFPREHRSPALQEGWGALVLWSSLIAAGAAAAGAVVVAWGTLPWYAIVIGAGGALLFAPLLLQPFPDSFVNGRSGLLVLAGGAMLLSFLMWRVA